MRRAPASRSRYNGLATVEADGRFGPALRLLDPTLAPSRGLQHRLVGGETLDLLAKRYYGSEELWWRIADANPARFPGDWEPGDILLIPSLTARPGGR